MCASEGPKWVQVNLNYVLGTRCRHWSLGSLINVGQSQGPGSLLDLITGAAVID